MTGDHTSDDQASDDQTSDDHTSDDHTSDDHTSDDGNRVPSEIRRLYRDPDGPIAGVATGLAHYFGVEPVLVQVIFIVAAVAGGLGIGIYLALWLLLPTVDRNGYLVKPEAWRTLAGAAVIAMMVFSGGFAIGLPGAGGLSIVLIVIGVLVLSQREGTVDELVGKARETFAAQPRHDPPPPGGVRPPVRGYPTPPRVAQPQRPQPPHWRPPYVWSSPSTPRPAPPSHMVAAQFTRPQPEQPVRAHGGDPRADHRAPPPAHPRVDPDAGTLRDLGTGPRVGSYAWATPVVTPYSRERLEPPPPRAPVTALTLAVAVLATGVVLAFGLNGSVAPIAAWGAFALVCGVGLIVSAFTGRGAWLLLLPATIALIGMSSYYVDSRLDLPFSNYNWSVGTVHQSVSDPNELAATYAIGVGELTLDLTDMTLKQDTTIQVNVGVGEASVRVPEDMNVVIHCELGNGELVWFGETTSVVSTAVDQRRIIDGESPGEPSGEPQLIINAHVDTGELRVENG